MKRPNPNDPLHPNESNDDMDPKAMGYFSLIDPQEHANVLNERLGPIVTGFMSEPLMSKIDENDVRTARENTVGLESVTITPITNLPHEISGEVYLMGEKRCGIAHQIVRQEIIGFIDGHKISIMRIEHGNYRLDSMWENTGFFHFKSSSYSYEISVDNDILPSPNNAEKLFLEYELLLNNRCEQIRIIRDHMNEVAIDASRAEDTA